MAEALARPFADVSPEMVYRGLYFVTQAAAKDPTLDPVRYLADQADELGWFSMIVSITFEYIKI